jgi:hypothetical protein
MKRYGRSCRRPSAPSWLLWRTASGRPAGSWPPQHRISRTALDAAARRLTDHGHLVRGARASRLTDPLLAQWLRRR